MERWRWVHPLSAIEPRIAVIEACHRHEAKCRLFLPALDEVIDEIQRAPALASAGADAQLGRALARDLELGRERYGGDVVARRSPAILGELDERRQRDAIAVSDVLE